MCFDEATSPKKGKPDGPGLAEFLSLNAWRNLRFGIAIFQSERPANAAQDMLLIKLTDLLRILALEILRSVGSPNILAMAERSVEDAPFAVIFAPGDRVIT